MESKKWWQSKTVLFTAGLLVAYLLYSKGIITQEQFVIAQGFFGSGSIVSLRLADTKLVK